MYLKCIYYLCRFLRQKDIFNLLTFPQILKVARYLQCIGYLCRYLFLTKQSPKASVLTVRVPLHQKSPVYTYRTELKKEQLRISLFCKNTADYFNELNPRADNKSFSKRHGYERLSRTMYLKVTIYIHVFNQDQLLFNGLSLKNNFLSHFWFRIYSIQCFISSCHFVWKRYNHGKNI